MTLPLKMPFLLFLLFVQFKNNFALVEFDSTLINSKTGRKFSEVLIDSFTTDLLNIAKDKRMKWLTYSSNDLAAVQAIQAMEKSLFDLSAYYAQNKSAVIVNKYLDGLAIEYVTVRCDSVASNRFPRNTKLLQSAWKDHNDYIYYDVNCFNNATDILINKYPSLHAEIRVKRSLPMKEPRAFAKSKSFSHLKNRRLRRSINDPKVCGNKVLYESMNGNITSPGHPGNYSAGITCVWHIKVPIKYAVSISFDTFSLEYDKRCLFDSVEFFDGASVNSKSIIRICGKNPPSGIRSSMNYLTIRMQTDGTVESSGFVLRWNYTDPTYPHPGYIVMSNIIVDQLGPNPDDLNKFALVFKKPTTCPLTSKDVFCYFQYDAVIISRIVSTVTLPQMNMHGKVVDVRLDHIVDLKDFPALYRSKKYCMRWNSTIKFTENGAWSRYGGKVYRTDDFSTTCHFNEPGIYAVFAEFHLTDEGVAFRFTGTFYAGIFFSIVWLLVLISQWVFSRRINVPEWINLNQAISLVLFLGTVLCGLHLEFVKNMCSLLAFFLYYFGLGVFFWHFLKAAQVSGKFDDFFAKGRNIYLFYFLLGWVLPIFIAGMAAGAMFFPSKEANRCWLALVGGTIWGYSSPTYFLVFANAWILYKVSKKTKKNLERFNHSQLRKRIIRDVFQLILYIMTWVFGILCILNKTQFALQFMFSLSITLSVLFMSLAAKQRRPGYQKIHYNETQKQTKRENPDYNPDHKTNNAENVFNSHTMSMKAYKKWKKFKKHELKLGKFISGTKQGKSFDYNAYYALDEEGSRPSLRAPSSIKSGLAPKPDSEQHTLSDRNSASESELDMDISGEEDNRSMTSANSRVETQINKTDSEEMQVEDKSEDEETTDDNEEDEDEEDEDGDDGDYDNLDYESSSRRSSRPVIDGVSNSNSMAGQREDTPENTPNYEEEVAVKREILLEQEENRDVDEENEKGTRNNEALNAHGNEFNEEKGLEDTEDQDEKTNNQINSNEENDTEEGLNVSADQESYEEEARGVEGNELPSVTVNAFGGSSENDEGNTAALLRSLQPSRSLRAQQPNNDNISVCSMEEEEEQDEKNENITSPNESHA